MVLLQLLVAEIGAPFVEFTVGDIRLLKFIPKLSGDPDSGTVVRTAHLQPDDLAGARSLLVDLIWQQSEACPALHRRGLDPAVVILPRKLLIELYNGLAALSVGETLPFVAAVPAGRQRDAWSRGLMRLRALEHVEFLYGKGWRKKAAYFEVCQALGVNEETVRWWKTDLRPSIPDLDERLKLARRAGKLADRPGGAADAEVMALLHLLLVEPLASFSERYRREHAKR
jgi:hypothetical protein